MLHTDSWEVGPQNWTKNFREEFRKRRGYDPLLFLPAFTGRIVGSLEQSERFLWDMRQTSNELIVEYHAGHLQELCHRNGMKFSIEPYDQNPSADLDLGSMADVPMCEFWSEDYVIFSSAFSCVEATSIAHVMERPVVGAESFTADNREAWKNYPGAMKNQGAWALCIGINRMLFHTFVHQAYGVTYKPGIVMAPWGVHWDRTQTWWPMVSDYHRYISRCQFVLQQGQPVTEILYLAGEGAPHAFRAPTSAFEGDSLKPDKRGYAFDGCSPRILMQQASVRDHRIVFPGGASYSLLVLPNFETMTPELLLKIESLIKTGAMVVGNPPQKSPSLTNYPDCDTQISTLAESLWGGYNIPETVTERNYGEGKIFWGGELNVSGLKEPLPSLKTELWPVIYPDYESTAKLLRKADILPDFASVGSIRYIHRSLPDHEVYFVSNRTNRSVEENCTFRDGTLVAELWDAVTGEIRPLYGLVNDSDGISIPMKFDTYQSFFVVFSKTDKPDDQEIPGHDNFPVKEELMTLDGPWNVAFDPKWGGPAQIVFDSLTDWIQRLEDGIRHYSGIAVYTKTFDFPKSDVLFNKSAFYLDLEVVKIWPAFG